MGKPYSQIAPYLCSTIEFDNVSCGATEFNLDQQLSLPGLVTNHFNKVYASKMFVVVDDQEQKPSIPVIDLEEEVFHLDY